MFNFVLIIISAVACGYNISEILVPIACDIFDISSDKINRHRNKTLEDMLKLWVLVPTLISAFIIYFVFNNGFFYFVFIIMTIIELIVSYIIKTLKK